MRRSLVAVVALVVVTPLALTACSGDEVKPAEAAWVGTRWQVGTSPGGATVAHVFGGEDQLFRVVFRAEPDEVIALQHLGPPYFRSGWGRNVVGLLLDDDTDWDELAELLTDSYCVQAPRELAARVPRPSDQPG